MNDDGDFQLKRALALDERPFRGSERPPPFPIAAQEGFDRRAPFEERKDFILESHEVPESRTGRKDQPHNTTFTHTSSRFPVHCTISKDLTASGDARQASQLAELGHKLSHCSTDDYQTQFGRKRKLSENDGSPYRPSSSALNNRYYEPYEDGQRPSNSRLTNEPAHTPLGHRKIRWIRPIPQDSSLPRSPSYMERSSTGRKTGGHSVHHPPGTTNITDIPGVSETVRL